MLLIGFVVIAVILANIPSLRLLQPATNPTGSDDQIMAAAPGACWTSMRQIGFVCCTTLLMGI